MITPFAGPSQALGRGAACCAPTTSHRGWWLQMLVWSAALAALLVGMCFVTPLTLLHYHAYKWRAQNQKGAGETRHFEAAARLAAYLRISREQVIRLLGNDGEMGHDFITYFRITAVGSELDAVDIEEITFRLEGDRVRTVEISPFPPLRTPNPVPRSPTPEAPRP